MIHAVRVFVVEVEKIKEESPTGAAGVGDVGFSLL